MTFQPKTAICFLFVLQKAFLRPQKQKSQVFSDSDVKFFLGSDDRF
jgi:hypothetical protein